MGRWSANEPHVAHRRPADAFSLQRLNNVLNCTAQCIQTETECQKPERGRFGGSANRRFSYGLQTLTPYKLGKSLDTVSQ